MSDELSVFWVNPRGAMPVSPGVTMRLAERHVDHPLLAKWWTGHGWPVVPSERLPMLGAIASVKGQDVAAAFCFMDNSGSGVAMIEWIVTDPAASARSAAAGIKAVVEWLMWRAGEDDLRFDFFLTTCRQPSLAKLLERCGYQITDRDVIHLCAA